MKHGNEEKEEKEEKQEGINDERGARGPGRVRCLGE